jgi:erythromycin esterase-like protein
VHANALAVAGAESYYRSMFFGDELTWNLRDSHFLQVLQLVDKHLRQASLAALPGHLLTW